MSDRTTLAAPKPTTNGQAPPSESVEERDPVLRCLAEWLADESGYDEEAWPELKEALERDRLSYRKRFDG
jgi:hypothetical protein